MNRQPTDRAYRACLFPQGASEPKKSSRPQESEMSWSINFVGIFGKVNLFANAEAQAT